MPDSDEAVLTVDALRVDTPQGVPIVEEVSVSVMPGEVVAIVGESGCGKTTVGMAMLGYARRGAKIASGGIRFGGDDLLSLPESALRRIRGSRISYVPQDATAGLNPRHRVGRQIAETLRVHGVGRKEAGQRALELMEQVGLPADSRFARRYPFELSGGQQQRIAIAVALACSPELVVLDEPTTGLDVTTQARILDLLRHLGRTRKIAFVYVTHDLAVVDGLADRVWVMYAGRIVESGPREAVFRDPAHPYTVMLLASVPRLRQRVRLTGIAGTAPPPGFRPGGCHFEPRCPLATQACMEDPVVSSVRSGHTVRCWRANEAHPRIEIATEGEARTTQSALLIANGIVASYRQGSNRNRVLQDVSFSIGAGECLALVGESGSGKTTLGRCVVGLHRPDHGEVILRGTRLHPTVKDRSRVDRQQIQVVFQNPDRSLNPRETVLEAIVRPLRLFAVVERPQEENEVMRLLERVRLPRSVRERYPTDLSGGERQRVAIARALAAHPEVLICDEITSALDVSVQAAVVSLLEELRADGLAMLFITHNLALVNSLADRVLVLEQGEMRDYGSTKSVIREPTSSYTRVLVESVPDLSHSYAGR